MKPLDLLILNAACDDWENLASIRESVASSPQGAPVEPSELEACLLRLVREKRLEAHEFVDGSFIPLSAASVDASELAKLWFFVTAEGRRVLDENSSFFR
ncbi:MAG: hypothetical protein IK066_08060 [Kiritimatiellae bacterium]|nr:hypothetical protein [Kiritimatiellia bacterium]